MDKTKIYKADCHTHPLEHRYYPGINMWRMLDRSDERAIEYMVKSGIERGLDVIAITDHNICSSGFYGKEYAEINALPIIVLPGCECSVLHNGHEIHILALGIQEPFRLGEWDKAEYVIDSIHCAGGLAVLAHPHYYPAVFGELKDKIDGYERYNGVNATLYPSSKLFTLEGAEKSGLFTTCGSDYHMNDLINAEQRNAKFEVSYENQRDLWIRINMLDTRK